MNLCFLSDKVIMFGLFAQWLGLFCQTKIDISVRLSLNKSKLNLIAEANETMPSMGLFKGRSAKGTGTLTDKYFNQGDGVVIGGRQTAALQAFQASEGLKKAGAGLFLGGKEILSEFFDRISDLKFSGILHKKLGSPSKKGNPATKIGKFKIPKKLSREVSGF